MFEALEKPRHYFYLPLLFVILAQVNIQGAKFFRFRGEFLHNFCTIMMLSGFLLTLLGLVLSMSFTIQIVKLIRKKKFKYDYFILFISSLPSLFLVVQVFRIVIK